MSTEKNDSIDDDKNMVKRFADKSKDLIFWRSLASLIYFYRISKNKP